MWIQIMEVSAFKKNGAKLWGAQILMHGDEILDFHKKKTVKFVILRNRGIRFRNQFPTLFGR